MEFILHMYHGEGVLVLNICYSWNIILGYSFHVTETLPVFPGGPRNLCNAQLFAFIPFPFVVINSIYTSMPFSFILIVNDFTIQSCWSTLLFLTSSENGQFACRIHSTRNEHRFPVEGGGRFNYRSRHVVTWRNTWQYFFVCAANAMQIEK